MKIFCIFILIILITVCGLTDASSCIRRGRSCENSIDCCSRYCRNGQCIRFGDVSDDVGGNPCAGVKCPRGKVCVLEQVQCVKAPCRPIRSCVPRRSCE